MHKGFRSDSKNYTYKLRREVKREANLTRWPELWEENDEVSQWTKKLIPNMQVSRNGELFYSVLMGYGSYKAYTRRIGELNNESCKYCGETRLIRIHGSLF